MPNTEFIEERLRFLEIDQADVKSLHDAKKILEPELDRMLEKFYLRISDERLLKTVFVDDDSIERARQAQKKHWLQTLLSGKFDSAYFDRVERIGRSHARVGLTPNWYIGGYCMMLIQFIQHISVSAAKEGRDASPIIEALCKAVLLDVDLVIHCYLEAKDQLMLDLLMRATRFTDDMENLNSELSIAAGRVKEATEAFSEGTTENDQHAGQLAKLVVQVDAMADKARQIDERVCELKSRDRLYLQRGSEHTGTFAKLKALILGE